MTNPGVVTIEDFETADAAAKAAAEAAGKPAVRPGELKLEGDDIPENLRGKTLADVLEQTKRLNEALRISEDARLALANTSRPTQVVVQQPEREVPDLTDEQLKTLMEENPLAAVQYIRQDSEKRILQHIDSRFRPLAEGNVAAAMELAKRNYPLEFKVFEKDINSILDKIPDKSTLSTVGAWEQLVSYVRGQPGNIDRYIEARNEASRSDAQQAERTRAGFSVSTGGASSPAPTRESGDEYFGLDETERRIAEATIMGAKTPKDAWKEYSHWKKVGQ